MLVTRRELNDEDCTKRDDIVLRRMIDLLESGVVLGDHCTSVRCCLPWLRLDEDLSCRGTDNNDTHDLQPHLRSFDSKHVLLLTRNVSYCVLTSPCPPPPPPHTSSTTTASPPSPTGSSPASPPKSSTSSATATRTATRVASTSLSPTSRANPSSWPSRTSPSPPAQHAPPPPSNRLTSSALWDRVRTWPIRA